LAAGVLTTTARLRGGRGRLSARTVKRHAAVSLWLNSGVPATEVARRAGHGVAVLLKIYAHCIDGQAEAANQRIADGLGAEDDGDNEEAGEQAS